MSQCTWRNRLCEPCSRNASRSAALAALISERQSHRSIVVTRLRSSSSVRKSRAYVNPGTSSSSVFRSGFLGAGGSGSRPPSTATMCRNESASKVSLKIAEEGTCNRTSPLTSKRDEESSSKRTVPGPLNATGVLHITTSRLVQFHPSLPTRICASCRVVSWSKFAAYHLPRAFSGRRVSSTLPQVNTKQPDSLRQPGSPDARDGQLMRRASSLQARSERTERSSR